MKLRGRSDQEAEEGALGASLAGSEGRLQEGRAVEGG